MINMIIKTCIAFLSLYLSQCSQTTYAMNVVNKDAELVYSWVTVDFDWSNDTMKQDFIDSRRYLPFQNTPNGIDVYKGDVYMSVIRFFDGVPSTLNKVVKSPQTGFPVFQPFPSWDMQTIGDCDALQNVPSMEIDPNNGWMWIIDVGRSSIFQNNSVKNSCPAKLVIYNLDNMTEIRRYEFPANVASRQENFLNDIVIDYVNGRPSFAYITDSGNPGLVVYDFQNNTSYRFEDTKSMSSEKDAAITVGTSAFDPKVPINGIAMSSDFRYVYFSAVSGYTLYQVPTATLRNPGSDLYKVIRVVGKKEFQSDGMIYARKNLYFGDLSNGSLHRWQVSKDVQAAPRTSEGAVQLKTVSPIFADQQGMAWIDSLAIDGDGYLWFSSSDLGRFFLGQLNFTQTNEPNFRVWKTYIGEKSYSSLAGDGESSAANAALACYPILVSILLILKVMSFGV